MIKKICISFICGLLAILYIAQHDQWVHAHITRIICQEFTRSMNCNVSCSLHSINFFSPEIILNDLTMHSQTDEQWQWHCSQSRFSFSWWQLMLHRTFNFTIVMNDCTAQSAINNGQIAIAPHIQYLISAPLLPVPIVLDSVLLRSATFVAKNSKQSIISSVNFTLSAQQINESIIKSKITLTDGSMQILERTLCHTLSGTIDATIDFIKTTQNIHIHCTANVPQCATSACTITGSWHNDHGTFVLHNADQTISVDPVTIIRTHSGTWINILGHIPITDIWRLGTNNADESPVTGTCFYMIRGSLDNSKPLTAHCIIKNMHYNKIPICSTCSIHCARTQYSLIGTAHAHTPTAKFSGSWHYNQPAKNGSCAIHNTNLITSTHLPNWHINPKACSINLTCDATNAITGTYACNAHHATTNEQQGAKGTVTVQNNLLHTSGTINKNTYTGTAYIHPNCYLEQFVFSHENGKPLITLKNINQCWNKISANIHYSFIRNAMRTLYDYDAQGDGTLQIESSYDHHILHTTLHLENGSIRLPHTYNFITQFEAQASWNTLTKNLTITDVLCNLHTGSAHIPRAVIIFDKDNKLAFTHIPLVFNHCLLNSARDLFAITSGNALITKQSVNSPFLLRGHCILDHAQLTQNMFSLDLHKRLLNNANSVWAAPAATYAIDLDLSVETKYPIRIDTFLLEADAGVTMTIKGNIQKPLISGSIDIISGNLLFPYKPLRITKGTITFIPEHLYNPMVELVAKNKIKKYSVLLQADGYLKDHQVILDATPPLTEEQIVSLLLVGSEQNSLQVMVPAVIAQNLKMALFGGGQKSFLDSYFKRANAPFNIHLVPSFTDQTGRGGLRGGIEIDVNDKWRALIQKNFNLSEDTRFELEYIVSDDISARAVRDERRDIGGEIEMRWKF